MMVSVRILCGVAALGVGIVAGAFLYSGPQRPDTADERAYALLQAGQTEDAIGVFTAQIATHPKNYMLYLLFQFCHTFLSNDSFRLHYYIQKKLFPMVLHFQIYSM